MGGCASVDGMARGAHPGVMGPSPSFLPRRDFDDVHEHYIFEQELYRGGSGVVWRVTDKRTGLPYACKSIAKSRVHSLSTLAVIQKQIKIQKHVSLAGHPHLVKFIQSYEDRDGVHLITELCTGGDLFDRITDDSCASLRTEASTAAAFHGVIAAIKHFHSMNVLHRDVRPENFMFVDSSPGAGVKCVDFGSAAWSADVFDVVGSPHYIAPELLLGDAGDGSSPATGQADVWSAGVMLYVMLSGYAPFDGPTQDAVFESIVGDPLNLKTAPWPNVSPAAKELVRKMLLRDPKRRFSPDQVLSHRWFSEQAAAIDLPEPTVLLRMRQFARYSVFKKTALRVLAGGLPADEVEGLQRMFMAIDGDENGEITPGELRRAVKRTEGNVKGESELRRLIDGIDLNGNHSVDFSEFVAATMRDLAEGLSERDKADHLMAAFVRFDVDGSGYITAEGLAATLRANGQDVTDEEAEQMLAEVDTNGDGRVDYVEFCNMLFTVDPARLESRRRRALALPSRKIRVDLSLTHKLREVAAGGCGGDGGDGGDTPAADGAAVSVLQDQLSGRSSAATQLSALGSGRSSCMSGGVPTQLLLAHGELGDAPCDAPRQLLAPHDKLSDAHVGGAHCGVLDSRRRGNSGGGGGLEDAAAVLRSTDE